MLRSRNISRLLSLFPLLLIFGGFYFYNNWGYLPFQYPDYGINFNDQRELLGQPPLEEYFFDKHPNWKRRKVWLTPDSLKGTQLHYSKHYWTERGEIIREFDFYDPIDEQPYDTVLVRRYFYTNDSVISPLLGLLSNRLII